MKKIIFIYLLFIFSFAYSQETDSSYKQTAQINNTQSDVIDDSNKQNIEEKFNKYEKYIEQISTQYQKYYDMINLWFIIIIGVVAIVFAVLSVLVILNIIDGKKNLKEAKQELEEFREQKEEIIAKMKIDAEKIHNEFGNQIYSELRIEIAISEIRLLLLQGKSSKKEIKNEVYSKLSTIIEDIDASNRYIVKMCIEAFPGDKDFERLERRVNEKLK